MSSLLKKAGLIFDENKAKPYLKMSIQRLGLLINKKTNQIKINKKAIARLLAEGREEKARIRVEQVIREDFTIEAYDILELHCELLANRMGYLASQSLVPPDLEQAVCTIIWAADRAEVSELATVKSQFAKKYGQEFVRFAELNDQGCVNPKIVEKLHLQPPPGFLITEYLVSIAEEYDVEYTPTAEVEQEEVVKTEARRPQPAYEAPVHNDNLPHGYNGGSGRGGGSGGGGIPAPIPSTAWPEPSTPPHVVTATPVGGGGDNSAAGGAGLDGTTGLHRRPSGGFAEATMGWKPSVPASSDDYDKSMPPPYSPPRGYSHDNIPSPPTTKPSTFDIPAAPGFEDSPEKKGKDGGDPPASPGGGSEMDDLAARLMSLRK